MADDENHVVEAVVTPQPLGRIGVRMPDQPIVGRIGGIVRPAVVVPQPPPRQRRDRRSDAIRPQQRGAYWIGPDGRAAVTLAFYTFRTHSLAAEPAVRDRITEAQRPRRNVDPHLGHSRCPLRSRLVAR